MQYEKFNKKRRQWEDSGVLELIKLWKVCAYELRTIKRNGHLYVAMAKQVSHRIYYYIEIITINNRLEMYLYQTQGYYRINIT